MAQELIKNPSKFIKCKKINNYGLSQLEAIQMLNKKILKYSEIEKNFGFSKAATFKLISSLKRKGFIKKVDKKGWSITNKGKRVLSLDKERARYLLYSNVIEI